MSAKPGTSIREPQHEEVYYLYIENNVIIPPLDYSFLRLVQDIDLYDEEPREQKLKKDAICNAINGKSLSRCLKLNNNALTKLENLPSVVDKLFDQPLNLAWLDLSFNKLPNITEKLMALTELQILYLHGNLIGEMGEVDKLSSLQKLSKLTLHGNPIEKIAGYRQYVLSKLPGLREFDFSYVTKSDDRKTKFWASTQKKSRRVKRKHTVEVLD